MRTSTARVVWILHLVVTTSAWGAACSAKHPDEGSNNGRSISAYDDDSWVVTGRFEAVKVFEGSAPASGGEGDGDEETELRSQGNMDVFVARYRPNGGVAWVGRAGGSGSDYGEDVEALPDGGCLVTGHFEKEARFGAFEPGDTVLTSAGKMDAFLARYRPDGTLAWARRYGGPGEDSGLGVALVPDGSILLVGKFETRAFFGPGGSAESLKSEGKLDAFVAHLAPDGGLLWARRLGGRGRDTAEDVAVLPDGSCMVAGNFEKEATLGDEHKNSLSSSGGSDAFLARLDAGGALVWCASAGGTEDDAGRAVAAYGDGTCVLTGRFGGEARFGSRAGDEVRLVDAGKRDIFVARYAADGALLWARRAGGVESDYGRSVSPGPDGSCTVTGYFRDVARFGAGEPGEVELVSAGGLDLFVARWNSDGTLRWARSAGAVGPERGYGIATLKDGGCVAAGSRTLGNRNLQNGDDLFLVQLDSRGEPRGSAHP